MMITGMEKRIGKLTIIKGAAPLKGPTVAQKKVKPSTDFMTAMRLMPFNHAAQDH